MKLAAMLGSTLLLGWMGLLLIGTIALLAWVTDGLEAPVPFDECWD